MISKQFADKCLADELDRLSENVTLRDAISDYTQEGFSDEEIEALLTDEYADMVEIWADDNNMDFDEMVDFILDHLDDKFRYRLRVNRKYDEEPIKFGSRTNYRMEKEIAFDCKIVVGRVVLSMDEYYATFKISNEDIVSEQH